MDSFSAIDWNLLWREARKHRSRKSKGETSRFQLASDQEPYSEMGGDQLGENVKLFFVYVRLGEYDRHTGFKGLNRWPAV